VGSDSVDAHQRTHTVVAVDEVGRKLGERTVAATPEGHLEAVRWAAEWPDRRFALEDCRHVTRRFEADLLAAGEQVVRVPTRRMAGERRGGRERGKSDPIDAPAVARAALREPDHPAAQLEGATRDLRLLVGHRDDLVAERSRLQNRLRWHLHALFPGLEIPLKGLRALRTLRDLEEHLQEHPGMVAAIAQHDSAPRLRRAGLGERDRRVPPAA
jgi:transposase